MSPLPPMKPNVSAIRFQRDGSVYLDIAWTPERNPEYAHTALLAGPDGRIWRVSVQLDKLDEPS